MVQYRVILIFHIECCARYGFLAVHVLLILDLYVAFQLKQGQNIMNAALWHRLSTDDMSQLKMEPYIIKETFRSVPRMFGSMLEIVFT